MAISFKKILRRITLGILVSIILIATISIVVLYFWGNKYAQKEITAFINQETKGKYQVKFSDLQIKPLKRDVIFSDLIIEPVSPETEHDFKFSTNSFAIEHIEVLKFIKQD